MNGLGLRSCILYGPGLYPIIFLPDICSPFLHAPDIFPRIMYRTGPSLLLLGQHKRLGIDDRCWGILCGLGQSPRILLGGPGLVLPKQGLM